MKYFVVIIISLVLVTLSCKNNTETSSELNNVENTDDITVTGDFIYDEKSNAAIVQVSDNTIYAVELNGKFQELNKQVNAVKTAPFDMVPVTLKAHKQKNNIPNSFWEHKIVITHIVNIAPPKANDKNTVKLGK